MVRWANQWGEQGWEIYHIGPLIQRHHQKDWGQDVFMKRPDPVQVSTTFFDVGGESDQ